MKKFVAVLALMGCVMAFATSAFALETSADVYGYVVDKYIWRGVDINNSETALQAGMDVSFDGFTVSYWTNTDLTGVQSDNTIETDIVVDYTFAPSELLSVSVGDIYYTFGPNLSTHEAYLGLGLDTLLAPSFTVYYDYDDASTLDLDGLYYSLAVGHDIDLAEGLGLSLGAAINYSQESPYVASLKDITGDGIPDGAVFDDFSTADLSVGVAYSVTDQISVDASYTYYYVLSDDAEDIGLLDDEGYVSVGATLAF